MTYSMPVTTSRSGLRDRLYAWSATFAGGPRGGLLTGLSVTTLCDTNKTTWSESGKPLRLQERTVARYVGRGAPGRRKYVTAMEATVRFPLDRWRAREVPFRCGGTPPHPTMACGAPGYTRRLPTSVWRPAVPEFGRERGLPGSPTMLDETALPYRRPRLRAPLRGRSDRPSLTSLNVRQTLWMRKLHSPTPWESDGMRKA